MAAPPPPTTPLPTMIAAWGSMAGGAFLIALFTYKLFLGSKPTPLPLAITLIIAGVIDIVLGLGLLRKNRVAWAYALALHIVGSIVCLLAIPAIAKAGVPRPVALLPVLVMIGMIVVIALSAPTDVVGPAAPGPKPPGPKDRRRG